MKKILLTVLIGSLLSSCSFFRPHKMAVEQGNMITSDDVSRLHTGMSESEVRDVMGNPVLVDIFSTNRLDYVYTYQPAYGNRTEKRITCIFERGRLKQVIG